MKQSIVSNDSVCGQWRPWSAQSDLSPLCPHMTRRQIFARWSSVVVCLIYVTIVTRGCQSLAANYFSQFSPSDNNKILRGVSYHLEWLQSFLIFFFFIFLFFFFFLLLFLLLWLLFLNIIFSLSLVPNFSLYQFIYLFTEKQSSPLRDKTNYVILSCTTLYTFEKKRENDRKDTVYLSSIPFYILYCLSHSYTCICVRVCQAGITLHLFSIYSAKCGYFNSDTDEHLGPVVQSVISLTSSLMTNSLTVVVKDIFR